jgi:hypothetical protein
MLPVLNELQAEGLLSIKLVQQGHHQEQRPIALQDPVLNLFSLQDLEYLDRAVTVYWDKTGTEVSDISHGAAWKSREDGEPMPYELAYLSDQPLGASQRAKLLKLATGYGWNSN